MKAVKRVVLATLLLTSAMASLACGEKDKSSGGRDSTQAAKDSVHTPP